MWSQTQNANADVRGSRIASYSCTLSRWAKNHSQELIIATNVVEITDEDTQAMPNHNRKTGISKWRTYQKTSTSLTRKSVWITMKQEDHVVLTEHYSVNLFLIWVILKSGTSKGSCTLSATILKYFLGKFTSLLFLPYKFYSLIQWSRFKEKAV